MLILENKIPVYVRKCKELKDYRDEYKTLVSEGKEHEKYSKILYNKIIKLDKELKDIDKSLGHRSDGGKGCYNPNYKRITLFDLIKTLFR